MKLVVSPQPGQGRLKMSTQGHGGKPSSWCVPCPAVAGFKATPQTVTKSQAPNHIAWPKIVRRFTTGSNTGCSFSRKNTFRMDIRAFDSPDAEDATP